MNTKYIWLLAILLGFTSCSDDDDSTGTEPLPPLTAGSADFSKYVAVGASFSAGFTDNALFIAGQQNSFPNMLSKQFALAGGGSFSQPMMSDNIGGFLVGGNVASAPRLFFNGTGPQVLPATPTTEITTHLGGSFNNYGIPGAKSFHLGIAGYGALNPYFGRMASSPTATVIGDAVAQNPTFFTLSEIGGNDVLAYATSGGTGVYQLGNMNPATYGGSDITDPTVFAASFQAAVAALTGNGAKGVVANVPYITSLPHFTTVPHNPLSPANPAFGPQIPMLNGVFGQLNQVYAYLQSVGAINDAAERSIVFSTTAASAVVIHDESLANISAQIAAVLNANPAFPAFVQSFGLPPQAAPLVAGLLGNRYGQSRQATANDLLVLPSSSVIGTVNNASVAALMGQGLPQALAGQFSIEGITLPLEDKWVLLPSEQQEVREATDLYNQAIASVADQYDLALVDFKSLLQTASAAGYADGNFILTTNLVTGGLVSLDGVHLTARGYAVMANAILEAIDEKYGSNFIAAGAKVKVGNYPTNYPPGLQ